KRAQSLKNKIIARNEVPREVAPRKLPKKSAGALEMPNKNEVIPVGVEVPQVYMPPPKVEVGLNPPLPTTHKIFCVLGQRSKFYRPRAMIVKLIWLLAISLKLPN